MIVLKLDVTKIPKGRIFVGTKGKYLDLRLVDKPDNYGNAGFVAIDLSKEARDAGEKGEIVGNWKEIGMKTAPTAPVKKPSAPAHADDDDGDVPF